MEVYSITNKLNGKTYIGSTIFTKEYRFGSEGNYSTSHLNRCLNGDPHPLYEDMRSYGVDNFEITTLYITEDQEDLRQSEDSHIREFLKYNSRDLLYNKSDHANPNLHSKSAELLAGSRSRDTKLSKYGNVYGLPGKESISKAREASKIANKARYGYEYGQLITESARKKMVTQYLINDTELVEGIEGMKVYLESKGILLSHDNTKKLVRGIISSSTLSKYPDLSQLDIKSLHKSERKLGITFESKYGEVTNNG